MAQKTKIAAKAKTTPAPAPTRKTSQAGAAPKASKSATSSKASPRKAAPAKGAAAQVTTSKKAPAVKPTTATGKAGAAKPGAAPVVVRATVKAATSKGSGQTTKSAGLTKSQPAAVATGTKVTAAAPKPATHKSTAPAAAPAKSATAKQPEAAKAMTGPAAAFAAHRARLVAAPASAPARAVPAAVGKASSARITAPAKPAEVPASPRAIAEKTAAQRQMMTSQKSPVSQRHGFKTNEFVVYPAHGVGRIIGIEEQEIAGMSLELFVINFEKEKLTLRVPTGKLATVGMRKLADDDIVGKAMEVLKGRARIKRTMWSRRAQEYVAKINSGDLISIAEVVRDLYRSEAQPEQSYSERQLYEDALDRMAREIAAVEKLDDRGAVQRITDVLAKSARGRRLAEAEETASDEFKAA